MFHEVVVLISNNKNSSSCSFGNGYSITKTTLLNGRARTFTCIKAVQVQT